MSLHLAQINPMDRSIIFSWEVEGRKAKTTPNCGSPVTENGLTISCEWIEGSQEAKIDLHMQIEPV